MEFFGDRVFIEVINLSEVIREITNPISLWSLFFLYRGNVDTDTHKDDVKTQMEDWHTSQETGL